jgi:anti-sigma factor RsiW
MSTDGIPASKDDVLRALAAPPPPPRRTDAAFARAVADDVKRRRAPLALFLGAPALALAAAGIAIVIAGPVTGELSTDAGVAAPRLAVSTAAWDEESESDFAIPSLEGSTDEELLRLDRALDEALAQKL